MNLTVFILLVSLFQTAEIDTLLPHQSTPYILIKPANSSDGQSRIAKHELSEPVRVCVLDSSGLPVAGAKVSFNILTQPNGSSDFSVNPTSALTDSLGYAFSKVKLGTLPGDYQIIARKTGLSGIKSGQGGGPEGWQVILSFLMPVKMNSLNII